MNCEEVRNHLLDYLDKALDTPTMTRIATHLISCSPCAAEANGLVDCIDQVAALPIVDVPLGFAQRVMAHVRDFETKPTIWQRWFLPWSRKLPLQAAALVLVGFIGVLLYQKEEQLNLKQKNDSVALPVQIEASKAKTESTLTASPQTQTRPRANPTPQVAKQTEPVPAGKLASLPAREQSQNELKRTEARSQASPIVKRPPIQVQEASSPSEPGMFLGDAPSFPPFLPMGGMRQVTPRPMAMERFIPSLGERIADYEFVVRRRAVQRRDQDTTLSVGSLRKSTDADRASPAAPALAAAPKIEYIAEIRFYNVAPEHFQFFKKELAGEAIIESESPSGSTEKDALPSDRQLLIKVTILPPAPPEQTPASSR